MLPLLLLWELLLFGGLLTLILPGHALGWTLVWCGWGGMAAFTLGHFTVGALRGVKRRLVNAETARHRDPTERHSDH